MDITEDISDFFFSPLRMAAPLYEKAADGDSFRATLAPRALMLAQAIISSYALPILGLIGRVEVLYNVCAGNNWRKSVSVLVSLTAMHTLVTPYGACAAILPSKFIVNTAIQARNFFEEKITLYLNLSTAVAV